MNLASYRAAKGLTQSQLAELLTRKGVPANQSLISQYERGEVVIPAERARDIEKATRGAVTRHALRPDLWER